MRRTGLGTCLLWLLLALLAGLSAQAIPPPRYLTDEEQIRILLHRLREGIRQQDLLLITDGFAPEIETDDSTSVTLAQARDSPAENDMIRDAVSEAGGDPIPEGGGSGWIHANF